MARAARTTPTRNPSLDPGAGRFARRWPEMPDGKVLVACKLPSGLDLREQLGVVLNGANAANAINGFGLTVVDEARYAAWVKDVNQGAGFPPLKNGLIFAHDRTSMTVGQAEESEARSGLEQLDAQDPLGNGKITPTDETQKQLDENAAMSEGGAPLPMLDPSAA